MCSIRCMNDHLMIYLSKYIESLIMENEHQKNDIQKDNSASCYRKKR